MNTGAYVIKHRSGIFYIGSATDLIKRRDEHNSRLKNNGHHCKRLQTAFNANGDLIWEYYYTTTREEAYEMEKKLIKQHANDPGLTNQFHNGYKPPSLVKAVKKSADLRRGVTLSNEHKTNISNGLLKANISPEARNARVARKKKPVIINDKKYASAKDAAKILNVDDVTLLRRCRSDNPKFANWQMALCEEAL
ncbi:endonuclease [Pseudomonas phage Psa21]|uniref:Endonuclease n=1 Tax=Pseudomonas phage Psa21 TaxID=2530023 RepID=A0A481W4A4_9CAUD|nr:endonuclease [Pseudomonas phage Psa21]QBJ02599.1 endonuclease [Pseudomonas phage Psa21]